MEWLNYHHLRYFWAVAREGGVTRASEKLHISQPTVSGQIRELERALGGRLFVRSGRKLELSEFGRVVYRYADEIFTLGGELLDTARGRPSGRPARLSVGVAMVVPKLVAYRLLQPAFRLPERVQVVCQEDRPERLFADLALHQLDVVLADTPVAPGARIRAYNHLLGECGVAVYATPALARRYRRDFPRCLDGAPLLLPTGISALRRSLDDWFEAKRIRPSVVGEFDDSAQLKVFGQAGVGLFPAAVAVDAEVRQHFHVEKLGVLAGVRERFYAISSERRLKHPAVMAISEAARRDLFE